MKANNAETLDSSSAADTFKWIGVFTLLVLAVVGNAVLGGSGSDSSFTLYNLNVVARAAGAIILIASALLIAATTMKGKQAISFGRESRTEIRRVVWPTRQETMQTTFIVLAVSVVVALVLWGVDGIMVRLVGFITGV